MSGHIYEAGYARSVDVKRIKHNPRQNELTEDRADALSFLFAGKGFTTKKLAYI